MFETMTYEKILSDMLNMVTSDVDKREGSVIYDALAPCAYQLAQTYFYLNNFVDLVSGDTAVGEYLDRVVADYGILRKQATYALRKIITTGAVGIGTRWGMNETIYTITALLSPNVYSATCELLGDIGNQYSGTLENIDNVSGVTATLTDIIKPGEETENDDNLRTRFYTQIRTTGTSGNVYDYRNWALEVPGCGDAKVFPLWGGAGTVKVVIVDNDKRPASTALIETTAEHIEEVRPIGTNVTVVSAVAKEITISAILNLSSGYSLQTVTDAFKTLMESYFKSISFVSPYVSHAKVGTILLGTEGVLDYSNLQLNGTGTNISLAEEEIPVLSTVELEV